MSILAMWVHGTAISAESPENLTRNRRVGWGTDVALRGEGTECWFHAAFSMPVLSVGGRAALTKVFILFNAPRDPRTGSASLRKVDLWDGPRKILEIRQNPVQGPGQMFLSGDHLAIDSVNTFRLVEPILLNFALGVSMNFVTNVSLGPPNPPVPPKDLIIAAVGADFDIQ